MVTLNLDTAVVKYANETTTEVTTQFAFKVANLGDKPIYVEYEITGQGNYSWTFDDGTTLKRETLNAGAVLNKILTIKPSSLPTATEKDSVTVKVRYYKDDQYSNLLGDDTINLTAYLFIQQSDMTWGNSSLNLDESTVVYDDFVEFSFIDNQSVKGKYSVVKVTNERDIISEQGSVYDSLIKLMGGGSYTSVKARFLNIADSSKVKNKIISVVTQKEGGNAYWWLHEDAPEQTQYKSADIPTTLEKYCVSLSGDWYTELELFIKDAGLKLEGLVIFNKF